MALNDDASTPISPRPESGTRASRRPAARVRAAERGLGAPAGQRDELRALGSDARAALAIRLEDHRISGQQVAAEARLDVDDAALEGRGGLQDVARGSRGLRVVVQAAH